MKRSVVAVIAVVVVAAGAFLALSLMGPDLREYDKLRTPRITQMKDQKMLEVRVTGVPGQVSGKAIGKLFGEFFSLRKARKDMNFSAPRARWPKDLDTKKEDWVGIFGLPVPDDIADKDLSAGTNDAVKVSLAVWRYGTVAEILHVGSYDSETPTIGRLLQFIKDGGYRIIGEHEEEYVKGPGPFSFNPKGYYTVIRYRVVK